MFLCFDVRQLHQLQGNYIKTHVFLYFFAYYNYYITPQWIIINDRVYLLQWMPGCFLLGSPMRIHVSTSFAVRFTLESVCGGVTTLL